MKFVEVKNVPVREGGCSQVTKVLQDFLKSGILAAEIVEFNDAYKNGAYLYQTARRIVQQYFPNEIRVTKQGGRVFITNLKEETK